MSFINPDKKFIFIHIPKTAGSSMELVFGGCDHETIYDYNTNVNIDNYYKFCFVRNPFDRLISSFFKDYERIISNYNIYYFSDFVYLLYDKLYENFIPPKNFNMFSYTNYFKIIQVIPQYLFISINNSIKMDFIGRFESITEHWNFLSKKFDFKQNITKFNSGKHDHYSVYYNNNLKKKVEKIYAKDFELFEYNRSIILENKFIF